MDGPTSPFFDGFDPALIPDDWYIAHIENPGEQFDMADGGFGYLSEAVGHDPTTPDSSIEIDENAQKEEADSTLGLPGYGLVVNQMSLQDERRLFGDLLKAHHWFFSAVYFIPEIAFVTSSVGMIACLYAGAHLGLFAFLVQNAIATWALTKR